MSRLFTLEDHSKAHIPVTLPMTYLHLNRGAEKPLLVFFHGYSDSGSSFLRRAFPHLDEKFEILAPNGLFPVPVRKAEEWRPAYSWYFTDESKNHVAIPPYVSAQAIQHLIGQLKLEDRPKILLGFSQGGFFLPFVFPQLKNVQKMFAIGAAYRPQFYPEQLPVPLDAIHGAQDEVIPLGKARESFELLKTKNPKGVFTEIPTMGHTMNQEARLLLKQRIDEVVA